MTESMKITSWTNHISGAIDDPSKFAKVIEDLQRVALQDAVTSLGFSDREYLCIKELSVPVKLDLSRSIRSISRQWSDSFRSQLERKYQLNDASVVYYRSLHRAHIACAEGVLSNNTQEMWAWQQSGVLKSFDASNNTPQTLLDKWSEASTERGYHQIALWRYLLQSPLLFSVLKRFNERHWRQHFAGLEAVLGSSLQQVYNSLSQLLSAAESNHDNTAVTGQKHDPDSDCQIPALMRAQVFIDVLKKAPASQKKSLICFAITICEPALAALPKTQIEQRLSNILATLNVQTGVEIDIYSPDVVEHDVSKKLRKLDEQAYELALTQDQFELSSDEVIDFPTKSNESDSEKIQNEAVENITDQTVVIATPYGGLFWLYNVLLGNPGLIQQLLSDRRFSSHTHAWIWCWLARQLLPEPCFDLPIDASYRTAIATFAGIEDIAEFEELIAQQPNSEQQSVLAEIGIDVKRKFLNQIEQASGNEGVDYNSLIRRTAKIERNGSWLEIEFSLNDVDVDIRRAGLDANPDFIHWLGIVVRFVYA